MQVASQILGPSIVTLPLWLPLKEALGVPLGLLITVRGHHGFKYAYVGTWRFQASKRPKFSGSWFKDSYASNASRTLERGCILDLTTQLLPRIHVFFLYQKLLNKSLFVCLSICSCLYLFHSKYSILFDSALFYSILLYSILFYSVLCYFNLYRYSSTPALI